jgi:NAD+--dinitrogen-reductase ADP-D-ribosyltransferase
MKPFANPTAGPTAIGHSTNLVGVPMDFLAHARFNDAPVPLHISGVPR